MTGGDSWKERRGTKRRKEGGRMGAGGGTEGWKDLHCAPVATISFAYCFISSRAEPRG